MRLTDGEQVYILVLNTSATTAEVKVTLFYESGAPAERTFTVAPPSRYNIDVRADFRGAVNRRRPREARVGSFWEGWGEIVIFAMVGGAFLAFGALLILSAF